MKTFHNGKNKIIIFSFDIKNGFCKYSIVVWSAISIKDQNSELPDITQIWNREN